MILSGSGFNSTNIFRINSRAARASFCGPDKHNTNTCYHTDDDDADDTVASGDKVVEKNPEFSRLLQSYKLTFP